MFTAVFCVFCPHFNPTIYHFGGFVQGPSQGALGCLWPPFCKPFLTKQPRTGGENAMTVQLENVQTNEYPHFDTVWLPLWKILATSMLFSLKTKIDGSWFPQPLWQCYDIRGKTHQKLTSSEKLIEVNEWKGVVIMCAALLKVCTDIAMSKVFVLRTNRARKSRPVILYFRTVC